MELPDLREIADLAHLAMSEQELQEAVPAFEQMLSFFAEMQAADRDEDAVLLRTEDAPLMGSEYFRPDTARPPSTEDLSENILAQAGRRDGRFIVIPHVL